MNTRIQAGDPAGLPIGRSIILAIVSLAVSALLPLTVLAAPPPKCTTSNSLSPIYPGGFTVAIGTPVTLIQEVRVVTPTATDGAAAGKCGQVAPAVVTGGANQQIQEVTLGEGGPGYPCNDIGNSYCSNAGSAGSTCSIDTDCDTSSGAGDGVCETVALYQVAKNPPFGTLTYDPDTSVAGVYGFRAQYQGGDNYINAPTICGNLTVEEEDCTGAVITIERASGPGEPTAPGGPYSWTFEVSVHACEDLYGVTAQGGTNGWAQLAGRSESSLDPSTGVAEIRKANRKTDVVLWTIGDMTAGDTETLIVGLIGSLKGAPDCDERFLSGPWSALFSTDGFVFEKSDYTGRVSIFTNSNGVAGDCP